MGNKLSSIIKSKDKKKKESTNALDSLPALACVTDNLPATSNIDNNNIPAELKTSDDFEEYFKQIIRQCISSNSNNITLIPENMPTSYMPLFNFPYTLFKQCSSNLVELSIAWTRLASDNSRSYDDPSKVINSFPSDIFDHLPNLKSLNLARYPFPYISDKIGNLTNLETLYCYGSQMMCFPRTMYKLTKLAKFDPYCSYELHYLPYEMKECSLNDSRISTGALWNNYKNRQLFPPLPPYPNTFVDEINDFVFNKQQLKKYVFTNNNCVLTDHLNDLILQFMCDETFCSICKCNIIKEYIYYIWVFETIGTDSVGLLGSMCPNCIEKHVKSKDFIANTKKCDIGKNSERSWSRISWGDGIGEDELFLYNQKGMKTSPKIKYKYEKHENDFYKIAPMGVSWKYTGFDIGDYNMENLSKMWIKFWKYCLFIQFDSYHLSTNLQTNEVNVICSSD